MSTRSNLRRFKNGQCPSCGEKGKPILYGLVIGESSDEFVRGGCCIGGDDPSFFCESCDYGFALGGRDYKTVFEFQREQVCSETGYKRIVEERVDLTELNDDELIHFAKTIIEARHELVHRGFNAEEMSLLSLQGGWKSLPLTALTDLWFYWDPKTRQIEYAAQFFAEGVKHIHAVYRRDRDNPVRLRRLADFQSHFIRSSAQNHHVWNLREPISRFNSKTVLELDLMQLMKTGSKVSESLLYRFANPVPDGQMWPAWYDPEQEFLD